MKARLGAGAIPFEASLVRLEDLAGAAGSSGPRERCGVQSLE